VSESVVVIGNFDGVHRGHQAVLRQAAALAASRSSATAKLPCVVLTFDPHPAEVLGRGSPPRLTTVARRAELLRRHGADRVAIEPFTRELAGWSARRFASDLLSARLQASAVVVGENFRFGNAREGDFTALRALGVELGFDAVAAEVAGDASGPFSSTRVRDAVKAGEVERAAEVLGRAHAISGSVVTGDQRGRTIGFPTANLDAVPEVLPAHGVYAIRVSLAGPGGVDPAGGASLALAPSSPGVMNVGVRPTVDGTSLRVEAHVLDFSGDLYGSTLRVELVARLRGEQRFAGLPELKAQIARDVEAARQACVSARPGL